MKTHTSKIIIFILTIAMLSGMYLLYENNTEDSFNITYELKFENNQYYYNILEKGQIIIQQKTIPAVNGKQLFANMNDAELCAQLVTDKLRNNKLPSITAEDLRELNITFSEN